MKAFVIAILACAACQSSSAREAPHADPADAVRAFFAAIDAGSCPQLDAAIGGHLAQTVGGAACAGALADYKQHGLRLSHIDRTVADGRDPHASIVHLTVSRNGHDEGIQVRVESMDGGYRMTTF
jgi:hypothetical protein